MQKCSPSSNPADFGDFKKRILVAEDNPANQKYVAALLNKLKLEIAIVDNGQKAVEILKNEKFDLIFMDIQMPVMNGFEATREIRRQNNNVPIIALTANAMKGDEQKCLKAGFDAYLAKPLRPQTLQEVLTKYLDKPNHQTNAENDFTKDNTMSGEITSSAAILINWNELNEICDDPEVIQEIAQAVLDDTPGCLNKLTEMIEQQNLPQIEFYAHRLSGAMRTMGATKIVDALKNLEETAGNGDVESIKCIAEDLPRQVNELLAFLSREDWIEQAQKSCAQA